MMYKQLNREQRYEISAFLRARYSPTKIARELGVSPSTITR
ncbi:helix-turn-helix domain-containing protein [Porphyromonas sp.]